MNHDSVRCVLLADRHHGLSEGIRGLLETMFDAVVMVADETSLQESALRLQPSVAVVDLTLARGGSVGLVKRLRADCPRLKLILLSVHDEASSGDAVMQVGADAVVLKRAIATDLLPAIDAVLAGRSFVSPDIRAHHRPGTAGRPEDVNTQLKSKKPNNL